MYAIRASKITLLVLSSESILNTLVLKIYLYSCQLLLKQQEFVISKLPILLLTRNSACYVEQEPDGNCASCSRTSLSPSSLPIRSAFGLPDAMVMTLHSFEQTTFISVMLSQLKYVITIFL